MPHHQEKYEALCNHISLLERELLNATDDDEKKRLRDILDDLVAEKLVKKRDSSSDFNNAVSKPESETPKGKLSTDREKTDKPMRDIVDSVTSSEKPMRLWSNSSSDQSLPDPFQGQSSLVNLVASSPDGSDVYGGSLDMKFRKRKRSQSEYKRTIFLNSNGGPTLLVFKEHWDGKRLGPFSESTHKDLYSNLLVLQKPETQPSVHPFGGLNLLKELEKSKPCTEILLLKSLEIMSLRTGDVETEVENCLTAYVEAIQKNNSEAHPLLLVALARHTATGKAEAESYVSTFAELYPQSVDTWLNVSEKSVSDTNQLPLKSATTSVESTDIPRSMWRDLSRQHAYQSPAMDKILDLVGLNNVKKAAVKIFELALQYSKMTPRQRSANIGSFNFCFAGNPGTGKTTVAKLFAELLRDSGLRGTDTFVQCNAQKLKEDGPEEFRKLITNAMNGVLFIDEAYDLDPNADFKGKPIVAELLTAAEKHQDKLSIIIAGYENDINKKLYSYNDGLRSPFKTVIFEDFDEKELSELWRCEIKARGWTSDNKVDRIATNRLVRASKRKGFCNALAVRKLADLACQQALSRADFNQTMMLQTSDIIGIHPLKNPEIQTLLTEVNGMIGWAKFKKAFGELIKLCGQSYDRELNGKPPLPISLNRMFLGPPGVGKIAAAKFYSRLLKHLNYLSDGQVLEKKADEFIGQESRQTQEKTLGILRLAQGKVLIIDDAYELDTDHGEKVLNLLVTRIQNSMPNDMVVLLLGDHEQMTHMLQNPGLVQCFPLSQAFTFDYDNEHELLQLLSNSCKRPGVIASHEFAERALEILTTQRDMSNFANAKTVDKLVDAAKAKITFGLEGGCTNILIPEYLEMEAKSRDSQHSDNEDSEDRDNGDSDGGGNGRSFGGNDANGGGNGGGNGSGIGANGGGGCGSGGGGGRGGGRGRRRGTGRGSGGGRGGDNGNGGGGGGGGRPSRDRPHMQCLVCRANIRIDECMKHLTSKRDGKQWCDSPENMDLYRKQINGWTRIRPDDTATPETFPYVVLRNDETYEIAEFPFFTAEKFAFKLGFLQYSFDPFIQSSSNNFYQTALAVNVEAHNVPNHFGLSLAQDSTTENLLPHLNLYYATQSTMGVNEVHNNPSHLSLNLGPENTTQNIITLLNTPCDHSSSVQDNRTQNVRAQSMILDCSLETMIINHANLLPNFSAQNMANLTAQSNHDFNQSFIAPSVPLAPVIAATSLSNSTACSSLIGDPAAQFF